MKEGPEYPATCVRWKEAREFCRKLSSKEGRTYRLPTEAEWEYACRAGSKTRYSFGDDASELGAYALYDGNAKDVGEKYAYRVGSKRANAWGIYDMHGNVYEWCQDWYGKDYYKNSPAADPTGPASGSGHVARGGCLRYPAQNCRSANRFRYARRNLSQYSGFRVVLVPAE